MSSPAIRGLLLLLLPTGVVPVASGCGGMPASKVPLNGLDLDQDGFPQADETGAVVDCDDTNPLVYPGAAEACDGLDNDCDGAADAPPTKGADARTQYWPDTDADGYGDSSKAATRGCDLVDGMVENNADCDDADVNSSPDGAEVCDGFDNDCNGYTDDNASDEATWFLDNDGDGYGDDSQVTSSCDTPPGSWASEGGDCDDRNASLSPGEPEECDGIDNDCDDSVDEEPVDGVTVWTDADGDGYGDPATETTVGVAGGEGLVEDSGDCDDSVATAYPGSTETEQPFDGIDQDCDGNDFCTDLDCDGLLDVVVPWFGVDEIQSRAAMLLLSGGVRFHESDVELGENAFTGAAVSEDFDGDGYPDVILGVAATEEGDISSVSRLLFGPFVEDGGTVEPSGELELDSAGAGKIAMGDFDADGAIDLVLGGIDAESTQVDVFYGVASGSGEAGLSIGTSVVTALEVADLDQDGFDDLIVCQRPPFEDSWGFGLSVFYGTSGGLVEGLSSSADLIDCVDVAAGNLDGDPELELVLARNRAEAGARHVSVWADLQADGTYALGGSLDMLAAASVQLVDLNQDGQLDAVFGAGLDSGTDPDDGDDTWETNVEVYLGDGSGLPSTPAAVLPGHGSAHPLVADLTGDGWLDILAPGQANDTGATLYTRLYPSVAGVFSSEELTQLSWSAWTHGAIADTNADGYLDVMRFSLAAGEGLVRHQGSASGPSSSGASLVTGGLSVSPPVVVD